MEFGLGFILLLLVVGGFAAYQGDRVGKLVGKRRLSILGLRPRYTSRIITICTGVLIVMFTLGSLILLSSSVRQALFGMERLQSTVQTLYTEVSSKNTELSTLEKQRLNLTQAIQDLTKENNNLQKQNVTLRTERDTLTQRTASLQAEQRRLESDRELLLTQLSELRKAGDYYFDQARLLRQANDDLRQTNFVYHALDVVASRVVDARQPAPVLRGQFIELLEAANQKVLSRGAGDPSSQVGVRIDRIVASEDNQVTPISADTVIDLAVAAITNDKDVESVIVQLVALTNVARGETVLADFNLIRNVHLYGVGDIVAHHSFDGRLPASTLFEEFILWMQGSIRETVRARGLLPQDDGSFGGVSAKQAYDVVDQIVATAAPVEVIAYAEKECWTRGPLVLGFHLLRSVN